MALALDSPYGAGEIGEPMITDAANLQHYTDIPLPWMYMQTQMSSTQTSPGVYDWTTLDKCILPVHQLGIRICFVLEDNQEQYKSGGLLSPVAAASFITAVLTHYPGMIQAVIAGNEAYSHTQDASTGFSLLDAVYPTVKNIDSSILVGAYPLLNGKSLAEITAWWQTLCKNPHFDFATLHYYSGTNDPTQPAKDGMPPLADFLTAYQQVEQKRPLWLTEIGWTSANQPSGNQVTLEVQASNLFKVLEVCRKSGVVSHLFYFGLAGLAFGNGQVRPAYTTYKSYVAQYPQWRGKEQPGVTLANYPLISQQTKISGDGSSPNAQQDCVPTSILSGMMWLKGITQMDTQWNPDKLLDMAYPEGYTGGTSAEKFVAPCKSLGVNLFPINGDPASLITAIHQQLQAQHPVIFTIPDPYVPASYGWTHVLAAYGESAGQITALDPWPGKPTTKSDAEWQALLQFNQIWVMEEIAMSTVPANWHDDGKTLTAPNGYHVVLGFRDYVLSHNWDAANVPLQNEIGMKQLEDGNPSLGGGTQQAFRWTVLEYTTSRGVFEMWTGQELLAVRGLAAKYYAAIQTLNQEVTQLQAQHGNPQDHALLLQLKQLLAPIS